MKRKKTGIRSYYSLEKQPSTYIECYLNALNIYGKADSKDNTASRCAYHRERPSKVLRLREESLPLIQHPKKIGSRKAHFYQDVGKQLYALGRYKEAGSAYRRAIQLEPGYQTAYDEIIENMFEKAHMYREKNVNKETFFLYQAIIMFAPETSRAYLEQGEFYLHYEQYQEAGISYREAIKLDPGNLRRYEEGCNKLHRRGQELYRVGRLNEGNQIYHDLLLFNPDQSQIYKQQADEFIEQGNIHFQHKSYHKSLVMFKRAAYVYPGDGNQYVEITRRFYDQEQFGEALELCEYILSIHQRHENALKARAWIIRALENTTR